MHPHARRPLFVLLALLACVAPLAAQEGAPERPGPVLTLPFELRSNKVYMETFINAQGPYPFVVDTGAPFTVVDWKLAESLGLTVDATGEVSGAGEGRVRLGTTSGVRISVGDLRYQPRRLEVIPLNETLSAAEGRDVMGLIGGDILERFVCEFDFEGSNLLLHTARTYAPPEGAARLPVTVSGHILARATVTLPGREPISGRFIIDTGARIAVSLNTHVVRQHNLLAGDIPQIRTTIGWGIGGAVEHALTRADSLTLAGVTFEKPTVTLSSDARGVFASRSISGVIGNEVLKRTRLVIDYQRQVVYLEPREGAMQAPFPSDAAGLFITSSGNDHRTYSVRTVVEGSPAADAGIKPGDVIVRVGEGPAYRYSLEELRTLFTAPDQGHTLELLRDGTKIVVTLKTRSLI